MASRLTILVASAAAILAVAGCATTSPEDNRLYGTSPSNTVGTPRPAYQGTVTRVDVPQRVIVMSDGRMYQVPADSIVYVNGQPVAYTAVQPGSYIALSHGQLVELRDGRYVVVQPPAAVSGYRQTIHGTVTDVDRNEIKVHTAKEDFEIPMQGADRTTIRKGDNVTIDLTFTPASPAALPR